MALFQKKPTFEGVTPLYSISSQKNLIITGLGNPGKEYTGTRHNIGFACLDVFAEENDFDPWVNKKDLRAEITSKTLGDTRVILVKPTTFMNLSGEAVQAVMHFYKITVDDVIALHDELDVPFGQIRLRTGGGAAGHNGVKSLLQHIGEGFGRVRVGIGPKTHEQMDSADFVLAKFSPDEQSRIQDLTREVTALLTETIYGGSTLPTETRSF